ncbi:MAG TPA: hypothetical protein VF030_01055 [Solirubrobacterales bacterium]
MLLPATRRRNGRALTAAAVKVDVSRGEYGKRRARSWQQRALDYIDLIPELSYASRFYARMLKQLRIYPALLDSHGKANPIEEGAPVDLLNRIQDPAGGRSQIQGNYGRLMFTTGEGYLFGRDLETESERWAFVWTEELDFEDGRIVWKPTDETTGTTYVRGEPGGAEAYRMWVPHPRRSGEPDSPMRSAVEGEIAEELIVLTKAVRATAVSRMVNGILYIPQEISPGPLEPIGDEDPENDPFMSDFIEHASSQIEHPGTAEARIPFLIYGAAEYAQFVKHIDLHDPQTDYMERDLRKEAVERLARGMDMPVEVLLGLGEANHWAARQILDDMWRSHGAPIAEHWCDDLNEAYLRPALREMEYPDWHQVVIGYDESQVVVKPDRSENTFKAHAEGLIGDAAARRELDFADTDKQTAEEREIWLALKMRQPEFIPDDLVPGARGPQRGPGALPRDAAEGPPDPGPQGVSRPESQNARILGAAELALIRCRELAGVRIRSELAHHPDRLAPADGRTNALVASCIGDEVLATLRSKRTKLVRGGTDSFRALLTGWGVEQLTVDLLATLIEEHAARTLTTAAVCLPDDFAKAVNGHSLVEEAA